MRLAGWFLLLLPLGFFVLAAQTPELPPQPTNFLSDQAGVVDTATRERIEQYAASLRNATGVEVAVLTVTSLQGQPVEEFANNVYRKWGIGQKTSNEGLLFVLAVEDRKTRLEVGYGLEPVLTDGYVGSILRTVRTELRSGKYGDAILRVLEAAGNKVRESKGQLASTPGASTAGRAAYDGTTPWWVYLFASVFGFCGIGMPVYVMLQAFRSSSWSNRAARGGGASSSGASTWEGGGGFSSYSFSDSSSSSSYSSSSSSDSSSSFSGGDSGGGGASSDW